MQDISPLQPAKMEFSLIFLTGEWNNFISAIFSPRNKSIIFGGLNAVFLFFDGNNV